MNYNRPYILLLFSLIFLFKCGTKAQTDGDIPGNIVLADGLTYSVEADYSESCSCDLTCQCFFGTSPPKGFCETSGLIEIKNGYYGDTRLDNVSFVFATNYGWMRVYVNENTSDMQARAIEKIIPKVDEVWARAKILSVERTPIAIERTADRVRFAVPTTEVVIEREKGRDGDPIRISGLSQSYLIDHTQFKAIINKHESDGKSYSHSGTNGFTSKLIIKSSN